MSQRKSQIICILLVLGLVLIFDQVSKAVVRNTIPLHSNPFAGRENVFFFLTHHQNPGLVNGIFHDRPLLAKTLPLLASLVLLYLFKHLDPASLLQAIAYGMVAGGALGNLIDRFTLGHVTDFLQVHFYFIPFEFPWKRYPAFNIADSGICTGVALLIFSWRHVSKGEQSRAVNAI